MQFQCRWTTVGLSCHSQKRKKTQTSTPSIAPHSRSTFNQIRTTVILILQHLFLTQLLYLILGTLITCHYELGLPVVCVRLESRVDVGMLGMKRGDVTELATMTSLLPKTGRNRSFFQIQLFL